MALVETLEVRFTGDSSGLRDDVKTTKKSFFGLKRTAEATGTSLNQSFNTRAINSQLANLKKQLENDAEKMSKLQKRSKELKTTLNEATTIDPALQKELDMNIAKIDELLARRKELRKERKGLTVKDSNGQAVIPYDAVERWQQLGQEIRDVNLEVDKYGATVDSLQAKISPTDDSTIEKTKADLLDVENAMLRLERSSASTSNKIQKIEQGLSETGKKANGVASGFQNIGKAASTAGARALKPITSIGKVLKQALKRILLMAVAYKLVRSAATYLTDALKTNKQFVQSLNTIKVNLATAFQPIYEAILPAINTLMSALAKLTGYIASFVSSLFGKTYSQAKDAAEALNDNKKAMAGYGAAAKKAGRQLAGFDQFNDITPQEDTGGGGGGSSGLDFSAVETPDMAWLDDLIPKFKDILWYVGGIAGGLIAWKIGSSLGGSLQQLIGLFLAVAGAVIFVKGYMDAWEKGTSWKNITEMFGGLTLAAVGLGLAFGPIGAAIALVVGGIAMLVLAFKELFAGEASLKTLAVALGGIAAIAIGIGLVFGWIPALIAAIVGIVAFLVGVIIQYWDEIVAWITQALADVWDFIVGIWNSIVSFLEGIVSWIWDSVISPVIDFFVGLWETVANAAESAWEWIKSIWNAVATWFNDKIVKPISDFFGGLWNGIKNGASALADFIKTKVIDPIVNAFKWLYNGVVGIIEGVINGFIGIINGFIKGINWVIDAINLIPGVNLGKINLLSTVSIPRMAKGGLAYGEVQAVVGDNYNARQNPEVIAPLSDLQNMITSAIVQRDIASGGNEIVLKLELQDGTPLVDALIDPMNRVARNRGYAPVFKVVTVN